MSIFMAELDRVQQDEVSRINYYSYVTCDNELFNSLKGNCIRFYNKIPKTLFTTTLPDKRFK